MRYKNAFRLPFFQPYVHYSAPFFLPTWASPVRCSLLSPSHTPRHSISASQSSVFRFSLLGQPPPNGPL